MELRNKIFTILGILLVVAATGSYFLFDVNIKQNSLAMGVDVLVAKQNIPEGTIIRSIEDANKYFGVRRITQAEAVPSSITVNVKQTQPRNLLERIKNSFTFQELEIAEADLKALVNKKVTTNIYKNQQVLSIYLSNDLIEFEDDERYFAVPTSYVDSVGAEISKNDYVDLWVHYGSEHEKSGTSEKIIEALKVVKVKGANNEEVGEEGIVPSLVIFKMTEEQIALVSQKMYEGSLFLTKWGKTPDKEATIVTNKNAKNQATEKVIDEEVVQDYYEAIESENSSDNLDSQNEMSNTE